VLESAGDRLVIATGEGSLQILELQPSGKRMLSTAEFLRGYPVKPGDWFGHEAAAG
jgi:methionyl-tRNA formyltransferase